MSRPRGLLHLSASVEEVAAAPAPQNPEPPNPAGGRENLGQASLAQRVLDHEGFAAHMDIDPKVRAAEGVTSAGGQELTSSRISSNIGDRLSGIRAQLDVPAKRDSSTDRRPSIPKSSLESGEHSIRTPQSPPPESLNSSASNEGVEAGYSGPATCLVFEPSFADVALMLEGVLQGIVRALTSGSVRLTHAKELHPVMGSLSRVALAHPKVSELSFLELFTLHLAEAFGKDVDGFGFHEAQSASRIARAPTNHKSHLFPTSLRADFSRRQSCAKP